MVRCGLDDEKLIKILAELDPYAIRSIDISYNPLITSTGYLALANYILDPCCSLTDLNVEGNCMKDRNFQILTVALQEYKCIEVLNISKNDLTDHYAEDFGKMIEINKQLRVLFAHYNRFMGKGGSFIAKAIQSSLNL